MLRRSLIYGLALSAAFLSSLAAPGFADKPRMVIVSIDGLRPEFYLDSKWPAPNLQQLRQRGASAQRMESVFPSITYANHASLVTGVSPIRHGIDCNIDFDWESGPRAGWNWEASRLQSPALWTLARKRGLKTAALSWPVSLGAEVDQLVPEIFSVPGANRGSTEDLIRQHSSAGLVDAIQEKVGLPFPQTFADWDAWLPGATAYLWKPSAPDLTLVHVLNLDWTQHRLGPNAPETRTALAEVDRQVGKIVENLDLSKTRLMVVGDHGFAAVDRQIALNRLFRDKGWLVERGGSLKSWKVYARSNGGSAAIYCKDPALNGRVEALLRRKAGNRYVVLDRAELDRRKTFARAVFAVSARPGYALTASPRAEFEQKTERQVGQHGHLPEWVPTGWIAVGPGIAPGKDLGRRRLLEVAPTICQYLGLDASTMELPAVEL